MASTTSAEEIFNRHVSGPEALIGLAPEPGGAQPTVAASGNESAGDTSASEHVLFRE